MRNFILGKNVAYTAATDFLAVADGAVGVFYLKNGVPTVTATGTDVSDKCNLVLGRPVAAGGPITIPLHKNKFSYVKGVYSAATTFSATFVVGAPTSIGDYTLIIAKKGTKFNERNKWTASAHVTDTSMSAAQLAAKLVALINNNSENSGVVATLDTATITITASTAGVDYSVVPADELFGDTVTITAIGSPAYGDAAYVNNLMMMAAADKGFEYTALDDVTLLYPNYPPDALKQGDSADVGFTIFTLKFTEPAEIGTRNELVNQIVQVAFPTGAAQIATFETVMKGLAGIPVT